MAARNRLEKEYISIIKDPIPLAIAVPDPKDWLVWHFVIHGLSGDYSGGYYYGKLRFPYSYPLSPPSMELITPNGRFIPNATICTTMSNYHPEEWSPAWTTRTIITALISYMLSEESSVGTLRASSNTRKKLAAESKTFNLSNDEFLRVFSDYIPQLFPQENFSAIENHSWYYKMNPFKKITSYEIFGVSAILLIAIIYIAKNK